MAINSIRRRNGLNAVILAIASILTPGAAHATTYVSTKLSYTAGLSNAVVQGTVQAADNLLAADGSPWTIYSLEVQKVVAGDVADTILRFRCLGGRYGDGTVLDMAGSPKLRVGDTILAFLHQGGLCQVSGFEYGVFWQRKDADGVDRLVDFRGRVLAAMGGDDIVLSSATIAPEKVANAPELEAMEANKEQDPPEVLPPPADAATLVAEIEAFATAYVTRPTTLVSVADLNGAPILRAPAAKENK